MPEVSVVKQPKIEKPALGRFFEPGLFRGNVFSVNPFTLMRTFTEEMDKLFGPAPHTAETPAIWTPIVEVKEKDGKLLVTAELPGLKKEDVKVHIDGFALVIEGERKIEREEKAEGYYVSERSYGNFYRSIALPEYAKIDLATAEFKDGVLEVAVPVPEPRTKRLDIAVGQPVTKKV